jgi:FixJ family two-component response regulator
MNCLEAQEGGCQWFVTDPENEQMLIQITRRALTHRKQVAESVAAGHEVQAGKHEVLARRAEAMEGEVLRSASQEQRERMMAKKREIEEEFL